MVQNFFSYKLIYLLHCPKIKKKWNWTNHEIALQACTVNLFCFNESLYRVKLESPSFLTFKYCYIDKKLLLLINHLYKAFTRANWCWGEHKLFQAQLADKDYVFCYLSWSGTLAQCWKTNKNRKITIFRFLFLLEISDAKSKFRFRVERVIWWYNFAPPVT